MQHTVPRPLSTRAIDKAPGEVLSDIFKLAEPTAGTVLGKVTDPGVWPWSVALVCKGWHDIVIGDRRLWTVVELHLTEWSDWERLQSSMLKSLENSSPCDVRLSIYLPKTMPPDLGVIRDLQRTIASTSFRLRELAVYNPPPVVDLETSDAWEAATVDLEILDAYETAAATSNLTHFTLGDTTRKQCKIASSLTLFPSSARLTSISLDSVYPELKVLPWSQIKSLTCNSLCPDELLAILPLASALESCHIFHAYDFRVDLDHRIDMTSLQHLVLRRMQPWPTLVLHAPSLTFLQFELGHLFPLPGDWIRRARVFIDQSNAALTRITIKGIQTTDTDHVFGLLESEQSLRIVKLSILDTSTLIRFLEWSLEQRIVSLEKLYLISHCHDGPLDSPAQLEILRKRLIDIGVTHPIHKTLSITVKNVYRKIAIELRKDPVFVSLVRIVGRDKDKRL